MKKTIFFDIGNVLVFFSHGKMCEQISKLGNIDSSLVISLMKKYGDLYERGAVSSEDLHQEVKKTTSAPVTFSDFLEAMSSIFHPNEPVIEIAQLLKQKGHPLFVLSNTCEAHFLYLTRHFPFFRLFDGHVLSYEVHARKPEKEIFEKALEIANCSSQNCFYVDDILDYVESARCLQIDAEQYTSPLALHNHLVTRGFL